MARLIKEQTVAEYLDWYQSVGDCVVCGYQGTSAGEFAGLREELAGKGVAMRVVKNRLLARALAQLGRVELAGLLDGPCAIAHGEVDCVELVKAVHEAAREHKTVAVLGSMVEGEVLGVERTEEVSRIPSREGLYSKIAGLFASPVRGVAVAFASVTRALAYAMSDYREKLAEEG